MQVYRSNARCDFCQDNARPDSISYGSLRRRSSPAKKMPTKGLT